MKKLFVIGFLSLVITSCSKKPKDNAASDIEKPLISSIFINGENAMSVAETTIYTDSINLLQITFTDNIALSQSSFNIHFANDSHEEESTITARIAADTLPFTYGPIIKNLSGTSQEIFLEIPIQNPVQLGEYHLEILLLDEAANSNEFIYTMDLINKEIL